MTDVVVLGLDGATWDVLSPLIDDGRLPNLGEIVDSGQSGTLESTFPPITAPAWLSMATGQNPGKTGVFYFLNRDDPDSFEFTSLGSDKFRGSSFWDVLDARDTSVGIFNYPMLYPPYEIDGFMVSGLGSGESDAITHPSSLQAELDAVTDGYRVKIPYADPTYRGRPERLVADLLEIVDKRERAIEYLLTEEDPDHFFGIVSATDWAQHYFWRYYDDGHALYDPAAGHEDALARIWERVDDLVGNVVELARADDATLLLVSDHGFGPVNRTFHVNEWLEREGFSHPATGSPVDRLRAKAFPYLRGIGERLVGLIPPLNSVARSLGESIRTSPAAAIDFERSVAFAPRQNLTCGMLYLLSDDPADKEALVTALSALEEHESGPDSVAIYDPEDLYHGPKTDLAPDLLIELDGFECAVDPRPTTHDRAFSGGPPSAARSGGHDRQGIIVASGPGVGTAADLDASIFDVAPTILALHDAPIPEECDGSVLADLLDSDGSSPKSYPTAPLEDLVSAATGTERSDHDAVKERLEDLGYI